MAAILFFLDSRGYCCATLGMVPPKRIEDTKI
jgi:hypothetical protein